MKIEDKFKFLSNYKVLLPDYLRDIVYQIGDFQTDQGRVSVSNKVTLIYCWVNASAFISN